MTYFSGCGGGFSVGGTTPNGTRVFFQASYTIGRSYTDDCGNVGNFTYYLNVAVPLTETGYNISAIQITPTNSTEIHDHLFIHFLQVPENTTVTVTGTSGP